MWYPDIRALGSAGRGACRAAAPILWAATLISWVQAADLVPLKQMSMELARDIAQAAVEACREAGYQVSAVVVDRSGVPQVALRDAHSSRFNLAIAEQKANAAILAGTGTGDFLANRPDIIPAMNHLEGVLVLRGALPVRSAGALLGAVGVSGAFGGEMDEKCARKALDAVADRLEFAELD